MNTEILKKYLANESISIVEAMRKIDLNAKGILYITDPSGKLRGSVSDGDIRRWILKTGELEGAAIEAACKNTVYLLTRDVGQEEKMMQKEQISSIPIVDADHVVVDIRFRNSCFTNQELSTSQGLCKTSVIIMAGGKGTRLYPYTKILPKPLIPIGDVPILERILNRFFHFGAKKFYLTVNYKKEMIRSYFAELKLPYEIKYIEEENPLGTAGSIRLIKEKFHVPVIVTNCDTLIDVDYDKILDYHMESCNDMTIISSLKNMSIPYGVLHLKEHGIVTSMEEKPQLSYFINTGMYIVNPEFLDLIPKNRVFHMTDLAEKMIKNGKKVGMYPISENAFWDMGEFEEMKKMEERINHGYLE